MLGTLYPDIFLMALLLIVSSCVKFWMCVNEGGKECMDRKKGQRQICEDFRIGRRNVSSAALSKRRELRTFVLSFSKQSKKELVICYN